VTIKVVDILSRASVLLQDTAATRFTNANLLKFFNDGQREVVVHRPDAYVANGTFACATGSKQTIPSGGHRLVNVHRNTGGRAVTQVERKMLDENLPTWHDETASTNGIEHFIYDSTDPKNFYVYPKAVSGTHSLEIVYSVIPGDISISNFATNTTVVSIDTGYANCLLDYVLYRAYQIDSDEGNISRAQMHYGAFAQSLGMKTRSDAAASPKVRAGVET
jgi:hypothetical protein